MTTEPSFVAIDFETATDRRSSACALAAIIVDGDSVQEKVWLIKPPGNKYQYQNIQIHGIHPRDTTECDTFASLWPEIQAVLSNHTLLAHNAAFDVDVLKSSHKYYFPNDPPLDLDYGCTLQMARMCYPEQPNGHGLAALSSDFNIELEHHNPASDARAVVTLAKQMLEEQQTNLDDLIKQAKDHAQQTGDSHRKSSMVGKSPTDKQLNYLSKLLTEYNHPQKFVRQLVDSFGDTADRAYVSQCIDNAKSGNDIIWQFATKQQMKQVTGFRKPTALEGSKRGSKLIIQYDKDSRVRDASDIDLLLDDIEPISTDTAHTKRCKAKTLMGKSCKNLITAGSKRCSSGHKAAA